MVTLSDALNYIGIDYPDNPINSNVQRHIRTAYKTLEGTIGENAVEILKDDPRIDELVLIYVDDLYYNRGSNLKISGATRNIVKNMELQLRLDYKKEISKGSDSL